MRRVVVTGVGAVTPIGASAAAAWRGLREGATGVAVQPGWTAIDGLACHLGGAAEVDLGGQRRKDVRTMGRVGRLAAIACDEAIADARLGADELRGGRVGLAYGSTHGSTAELEAFSRRLFDGGVGKVSAVSYLKFMSNTCAANLGILYGIRGRVLSTCSACVSASQAIGQGFEAIRAGQQDVMICGGAEELYYIHAAVFALLYATSSRNDAPGSTPRPFDAARDGLVVAEGAGTLILEERERALGRGATIHGELLGYGTNCDGGHITSPSIEGMAGAMELALADAGLSPDAIDYVNAHATGTRRGDACEAEATRRVFGARVPVSSNKGATGHTLGACGAIESIFCLAALRDGAIPPTRNLTDLDPECAALDHVRGWRSAPLARVMNNNFAFGGMNTSLIFGR